MQSVKSVFGVNVEAGNDFDANVFGVLSVVRVALPVLRKQSVPVAFSNISSFGGCTANFANQSFPHRFLVERFARFARRQAKIFFGYNKP